MEGVSEIQEGDLTNTQLLRYLGLPEIETVLAGASKDHVFARHCQDFGASLSRHFMHAYTSAALMYATVSQSVLGSPGSLPAAAAQFIALPPLQVANPWTYSLTTLPRALQDLLESSVTQTCPTCNTVPFDPAMCLFCGRIVYTDLSKMCSLPAVDVRRATAVPRMTLANVNFTCESTIVNIRL